MRRRCPSFPGHVVFAGPFRAILGPLCASAWDVQAASMCPLSRACVTSPCVLPPDVQLWSRNVWSVDGTYLIWSLPSMSA